MEDQDRINRIWEYLNEEGIFSIEELNKRVEEMPKIDIGMFVGPIKEKTA